MSETKYFEFEAIIEKGLKGKLIVKGDKASLTEDRVWDELYEDTDIFRNSDSFLTKHGLREDITDLREISKEEFDKLDLQEGWMYVKD